MTAGYVIFRVDGEEREANRWQDLKVTQRAEIKRRKTQVCARRVVNRWSRAGRIGSLSRESWADRVAEQRKLDEEAARQAAETAEQEARDAEREAVKALKKRKRNKLLIWLAVVATAIAAAAAVAQEEESREAYYVTAEKLNVRSGPAAFHSAVSALHRGARVSVYEHQGSWFRISDLASAGLWVRSDQLSALRPADKNGSINLEAFNSCKKWLLDETGYRFFAETARIREYEQAGEYSLRSNLLVVTALQQQAEVGFECNVYIDQGIVSASIDLQTFAPEDAVSTSAAGLNENRLKWGGSGCASMKKWKKLTDEIAKGNYEEDIVTTCTWLEKGTRVYGPIENIEYKGYPFVKVRLSSGREVWIEPSIL